MIKALVFTAPITAPVLLVSIARITFFAAGADWDAIDQERAAGSAIAAGWAICIPIFGNYFVRRV